MVREVPLALKKYLQNQNGFSLLEILIVTAIMGAIAVIASSAIRGGLQTKKKLDARLRVESTVFDALRLMSTDIERAFHYQHALYEIDRMSLEAQNAAGGGNPNDPSDLNPNPQGVAPPPERLTNMVGKENMLHFTTLNHYRTIANSQESNQIEVGYYIESCKSRSTGKESRCLWRRTSLIIDNDVTRGGDATALLENVKELKFEYLSENINEKDWKREWLTDNNGSINTQNIFPSMIKIFLSVEDKDNKEFGKFQQTIIASIRSPNNIDPGKHFQTNSQTRPTGAAGQPENPGGNE